MASRLARGRITKASARLEALLRVIARLCCITVGALAAVAEVLSSWRTGGSPPVSGEGGIGRTGMMVMAVLAPSSPGLAKEEHPGQAPPAATSRKAPVMTEKIQPIPAAITDCRLASRSPMASNKDQVRKFARLGSSWALPPAALSLEVHVQPLHPVTERMPGQFKLFGGARQAEIILLQRPADQFAFQPRQRVVERFIGRGLRRRWSFASAFRPGNPAGWTAGFRGVVSRISARSMTLRNSRTLPGQ